MVQPGGEQYGPDGQLHRRYLLCQVLAVESRQPGYYKCACLAPFWVQLLGVVDCCAKCSHLSCGSRAAASELGRGWAQLWEGSLRLCAGS